MVYGTLLLISTRIFPFLQSPLFSGKYYSTLGFGYDSTTDVYKVIYVTISADPELPLVADVYSCNACSWSNNTVITSTFVLGGVCFTWPTILHGRPYWYDCKRGDYYLMSFDTQHEVFKLLPGIEVVMKLGQLRRLVNLRDSLAILIDDFTNTTSRLVDVHIFDERCGCWSKKYTIGPVHIPGAMVLLNCFNNGDLLYEEMDCFKILAISHEAHGIDCRLASRIYKRNIPHVLRPCSYCYGYTESLVSVKGMNPMHLNKVKSDLLIIHNGKRTVKSLT